MKLPSLTALRAFEAAARHSSIQRASEELCVTRTAVSRQVALLEEELSTPLFVRLHRSVRLTDEGRALYESVHDAFLQISRTTARYGGVQRARRLVVNIDPDIASLWLVPLLGSFTVDNPDITVEISTSPTLNKAQDRDYDCAIHFSRRPPPEMEANLLVNLVDFPVCQPPADASAAMPWKPGAIAGQTLLHDRSTDAWKRWLTAAGQTDIDWSKGPVFNETSLCLEAAAAGQGIAIGDNLLALRHIEQGRLVAPFRTAVVCPDSYYFLLPPMKSGQEAVTRFRDWIIDRTEHHEQQRANALVAMDVVGG